jgi:hypothetical protein
MFAGLNDDDGTIDGVGGAIDLNVLRPLPIPSARLEVSKRHSRVESTAILQDRICLYLQGLAQRGLDHRINQHLRQSDGLEGFPLVLISSITASSDFRSY